MLLASLDERDRAATLAAYYILSYLSMSLPAVAAGAAAQHYGAGDRLTRLHHHRRSPRPGGPGGPHRVTTHGGPTRSRPLPLKRTTDHLR